MQEHNGVLPDPEELIVPTLEMQEKLIFNVVYRNGLHPAAIKTIDRTVVVTLRDKQITAAVLLNLRQWLASVIRRHEMFILRELSIAVNRAAQLQLILTLVEPRL